MQEQQQRLASRLLGYYNYFGITCNYEALEQLFRGVRQAWHYWLGRRSQRAWRRSNSGKTRFPAARSALR